MRKMIVPPVMITHLLWNIINSILTSNDLNHIATMKQNYLHALWIYKYYEISLSPPALTTSLIWTRITSTNNTYWIIYGTSLPPPALTTSLCFGIAERDFSIGFFAFSCFTHYPVLHIIFPLKCFYSLIVFYTSTLYCHFPQTLSLFFRISMEQSHLYSQ